MNKYITKADEDYKLLEPWIQWVTVYTGESSADHGVHRLGGSRRKEKRQIFEAMEQRGAKILALSPMNAVNRLKKKKSRFIPDPWTITHSDSSIWSRAVHGLLQQAVNDNSSGVVSIKSILTVALLFGFKCTWKGRFYLMSRLLGV